MQFSHLHNHTQFSLLDGASSIPRLYDKAGKDGMPAVAITDHGNMFGVFQFVAEAWKNTKVVGTDENGKEIKEPVVKPIVGCEFYLVEDRHKHSFSRAEGRDKRYHQLFLAKDETGYKNLVKLCSLGYMEGLYGKYPRIDKELVLKYHEGLIATTCCIGARVPQFILYKGEAEAETEFKWWLDLFGEDYYVEIQRHDIPEQNQVNECLFRFAKKYNVPIIASNDSHYVEREDANAHDILLCINTGEKQSTPSAKEFTDDNTTSTKNTRFAFYNDQFYFKKRSEMETLFADVPQAVDNTQMIVDKVKPLQLTKDILLPHFQVPEEFNDDQDAYLEHLTWTGAKERYKDLTPEIEERLRFELFTIRTMGFAGYFLIVSDFIRAGRELGVFIGPGRGSAAGSVVAYCIGITNIDPIKYNLLFERFLNPDRKSMPDIDTDFEDSGRQTVIDYVVNKYGRNQVAHIVTYGTMAARSSIKDVARVMELPLPEANALAKLVPEKPGISLKRVLRAPIDKSTDTEKSLRDKEDLRDEDLENVKKLREWLADEGSLHSKVLHEAEKLEGSVRNTGIHAAGIIIAPKDLSELIPVSSVKDVNLLITQYEGSVIENAGVIKMDFLGLKNLSIIKDALAMIKRNHGEDIDIDDIPLDDEETFRLFQEGNTNAIFQFESVGMQKNLKELKPDKFDDLIAMNALYRPGPLQYIPNFIKRKHGEESIVYDLPEMEEYLADTYGITVYQEQVMLLAQKLAGFSKGDADVLRKAMGKKKIDILNKMEIQFMEGAQAKGHPADKLKKIWDDWKAFAQYAFNKSHSTCYAFVAYQTAYLKAHYPSEYMAAVMNNAHSIDKITFFMEECQRMGIDVLGPDINESQKGFSVNKNGVIRFGMGAIKGVGDAAVDNVIAEREENGVYSSPFDLTMRVNQRSVNKKSLEALVLAGAFDCFKDLHRAQYFAEDKQEGCTNLELIIKFGQQYQNQATMNANSLFGDVDMPEVKPPKLTNCEPWPGFEALEKEKEMIGIYLSGHPLDSYQFEMKNYGMTPISELPLRKNQTIRIAGILTEVVHRKTQKGDGFAKVVLTDFSGSIEIMFWRDKYVKFRQYLEPSEKIVFTGVYEDSRYREGQTEFQVSGMMLLSEVKDKMTQKVTLPMSLFQLDPEAAAFLRDYVHASPGRTGLSFKLFDEAGQLATSLASSKKIALKDELIRFCEEREIPLKISVS
ncbi:MAG TPA: DNA polymerase III subunit alpha [Edaphocola sp.]|nr:DNA polymerase III subunit alpha [Edaphocola sp.]